MQKTGLAFIGIAICLALFCTRDIAAQDSLFSSCGVIYQGTQCLYYIAEGDSLKALLEDYAGYGPGDSVFVSGIYFFFEDTICDEAEIWIVNNYIGPCQGNSVPYPYEGWGTLVFTGDCLLYRPEGSLTDFFLLENYGSYGAGDSVHVSGMLDFDCQSECPLATGCIDSNTIALWDEPCTYPYQSYGVLFQGVNCLLYGPHGDFNSPFVLDYYGDFQAGDSVFVSGELETGYQGICSGAIASIRDNIIDSVYMETSPIAGNAVVELAPSFAPEDFLEGSEAFLIDSIAGRHIYLVGFADSISSYLITTEFLEQPGVVYCEPNFEVDLPENLQLSISFPDEYAPPLDIENNQPSAFFHQTMRRIVGADSANLITTGTGIEVAIIDNGFELDHPYLSGAFISSGYDFFDNDMDAAPDSGIGTSHGTFVAGLIHLLAPDCGLIPIKALNADGKGNCFAIAGAIYYAIDSGAQVINLSFGTYQDSYLLRKACADAHSAGVVLVAAAGNDSTAAPIYPAAYPEVLSISAVDTLDYIADFSNHGTTIDFCAPGIELYSCLAGEFDWGRWSGTSFSAPQVSALCGLLFALDSDLTLTEMETHIRVTSTTEFAWGTISAPDLYYGYGRIDLKNSIRSLFSVVTQGCCGDVNHDAKVNISDVVCIINYIFLNGLLEPDPIYTADVNHDFAVNISDAIYLMNFIYLEGPEPNCPPR